MITLLATLAGTVLGFLLAVIAIVLLFDRDEPASGCTPHCGDENCAVRNGEDDGDEGDEDDVGPPMMFIEVDLRDRSERRDEEFS